MYKDYWLEMGRRVEKEEEEESAHQNSSWARRSRWTSRKVTLWRPSIIRSKYDLSAVKLQETQMLQ